MPTDRIREFGAKGQDMKESEGHCRVFWLYFRCKEKLQTGFKPESDMMQFVF